MTAAIIGMGTTFGIADTATPTSFTDIAEIYDLTLPSLEIDQVDVTNFGSPNNRREYIAGLTDSGEASFEMNYVPNSASDILLRSIQGVAKICKVTFPNGATVTFTGNLQSYVPTTPVGDRMTANVTFKVSGNPTYGP